MLTEQPVGVKFTETMKGYFSCNGGEEFDREEENGPEKRFPFEFTVNIAVDDVARMIEDPNHEASMTGVVHAPRLSRAPIRITEGHFNLFVEDPERAETRRMVYRMRLETVEGERYYSEGAKTIHNDPGWDMVNDLTVLDNIIYKGVNKDAPVVGTGKLRISLASFILRVLPTLTSVNAPNGKEGLKAVGRLGKFFVGVLYESFGGIFGKPDLSPPARQRRALRLCPPEIHEFETADRVRLVLTRYRGGPKGPVILSPGFSTPASSFNADTVDTNLTEYLYRNDYDVWLFDYRASPDRPPALQQFPLDDIAQRDYPAAVKKVLDVTGAESAQVVAHCVGSLTLLMALALKLEGVRSAVCSNLALHWEAPALVDIKSRLHIACLLRALGVQRFNPDYTDPDWLDKLAEIALRFLPTRERCRNPVCRRVLGLWGEAYLHSQLNDSTHRAIDRWFGPANLSGFRHMAHIVNKGHAVSESGEDIYMPNTRNIAIPISFLHGAKNNLILPEGTRKTYELLRQQNPSVQYDFKLVENYGHMDCFIGRNAASEVYPYIEQELARYNAPAQSEVYTRPA
jgi:cholesterol oxidase